MKRKIITSLGALSIAIGMLAPTLARAELHQFTSAADPTKTFWAHLANYDAKKEKVTVRYKNGKVVTFPQARLTSEDIDYVKKQYEIIKIGRYVKIDAKVKHGDRNIKKSSGKKEISSSKYFDIEISNTNREEVKDLTVRYEIHLTQGGKRGVLKGDDQSISTLYSGVPHKMKSTEVNLSQQIPLSTATTGSGGPGCRT